ncbi:MAG TPA: ATP-dependent helicase HrpB [Nitrospira sp.]|nr:ATP-dependent helicase HrpB [Nitrospira sp.]
MNRLPIEDVLPALSETLTKSSNAVLSAPPGAGKSTRVPLALLDAPWLAGRTILMLEPRRLAARAAAHRMAFLLGESVGATVGYRMRLDSKIGPGTRIEVVTEGILTRLLLEHPELDRYGAILFDEFHERSLQADVGLALCLETQRLVRPDLRLLVMSATLDCGPVSQLLGDAPIIPSEGRMFGVETRYLTRPLTGMLEGEVAQAIRRSLSQDQGSLLVFLPGMAEIRRVERLLLDANPGPHVVIAPLHGDLPQSAQDKALVPAESGTRKVVLATSIAETSLTIDGVRIVIDAGQLRVPRFDPRSGLTRLETIRVTQDSADQRRGRAGRLESGICYRLWTEREHLSLAPRRTPDILEADLAPMVLDLAQWGESEPSRLHWLNPPPSGAVAQAKELLIRLGALDASGRLTPHGRQMADLPLHPRLSHMLLKSMTLGCSDLACELAALLSERDVVRGPSATRETDVRLRIDVLRDIKKHIHSGTIDRGTIDRIARTARQWRTQLAHAHRLRAGESSGTDAVGLLLALAYPDRIAQRQQGNEARYVLANGRGALFAHPDPLGSEPFLVIAALDAGTDWARIDLAAPLSLKEIEQLYAGHIQESEAVTWDERTRSVHALRQRRFGALILSEAALSKADPSLITKALLDGIRRAGLATLAWTPELLNWRKRIQFLRRLGKGVPTPQEPKEPHLTWPDLSDERLLDTLEDWLGPYLSGVTTLERVQRMDLNQPLHTLLAWHQQRDLDRLAPSHLTVPSGSTIRLDYDTADLPVLAVRLQEMFGCRETPRIANNTVPVLLHLLSPAKRPVQVTSDLTSFWINGYPAVRKELRGRYPKHHWPDDPLTAPPTAKTKRRT